LLDKPDALVYKQPKLEIQESSMNRQIDANTPFFGYWFYYEVASVCLTLGRTW